MANVKLYLDVDGVLNAFGEGAPEWAPWTVTRCSTNQGSGLKTSFHIRHSLAMGQAIADLDVEICWLTTWGNDANKAIGPLFGWPSYEVVPGEEGEDWNDEEIVWWKWKTLQIFHEMDPRPFIWADDDLGGHPSARAWAASVGGLAIPAACMTGLSRADIAAMATYITEHR